MWSLQHFRAKSSGAGSSAARWRTWKSERATPAQAEVTVAGVHFVQEDSPDEIGRAIAGWMLKL